MRFVPFQAQHFADIEWQASQQAGLQWHSEELAEDIAEESVAWTAIDDAGQIVACAGVYPTRILVDPDGEHQALESLAWAVFSPLLKRYPKSTYAAISRFLASRTESRIEAYVDPRNPKAASFLERLGFQFETTLSGEHPSGEDILLYVRVRH